MYEQKTYWFQNSRKNIRLGLPIAWQGWAVYAGYLVIVLLPLNFRPVLGSHFPLIQLANQIVWTIILIVVAFKKGRPAEQPEETEEDPDKYWFPKKEIGIGYGFPVTWQGWVVLLVFILGSLIPVIVKPLLGKHYIWVMIVNMIVWLAFLLTMTIKHGEK